MADSIVPVTVVPCTVSQYPVFLAQSNMRQSKSSRLLTIPSNLDLLMSSQDFLTSLLSSLTAWRWSPVENYLSSFTSLINYEISRCELRNYSSSDVTGFWRPRPYILTRTLIKVPTMGGRDLDFPEKRQKKFLEKLLHSRKRISRVFFHELQKYPLRLDFSEHRGIIFLGIFPCSFSYQ